MFPYLSSTGNYNVVLGEEFKRASEMKDERVDLVMEMIEKKYDWSKHEWGFKETVEPFVDSSDEAPSGSRASAPSRTRATGPSGSRASAPSRSGGPANAAKTRSQTKVNKK